MVKRKIIDINKELCNGCGLCVTACHEGAIGMIDGKAELLRDDYCDGLGDCLPVCPTNAITFVEREALAFNEAEVKRNMEHKKLQSTGGCPGLAAKTFDRNENAHQSCKVSENNFVVDGKSPDKLPCGCPGSSSKTIKKQNHTENSTKNQQEAVSVSSQLNQWPVQIKLVPVNAPYFNGAKLLIAADCSAFAYGDFHNKFMKDKITIIGCPKLDEGDYADKLTQILKNNNIKSVTVVRMQVPCCSGIANAAIKALQNSGKMIPWNIVTLTVEGKVVED